jgi:hypothetical protein
MQTFLIYFFIINAKKKKLNDKFKNKNIQFEKRLQLTEVNLSKL